MLEAISNVQTLALLVLLVIAFVVAFKLLEMVFETVMVSALSGVFYIGLVYLFNFPLTLDRILLFAFLGSAFYMGYSVLASAYTVFAMVIGVPYSIAKGTFGVFGKILGGSKRSRTDRKLEKYVRKVEDLAAKVESNEKKADTSDDEEEERDVKEVVLDKVKEDDG